MSEIQYPLDVSGSANSNLILNERHVVTRYGNIMGMLIVPKFAPFFSNEIVLHSVSETDQKTVMEEGVDYYPTMLYLGATRSLGVPLYGGIAIINDAVGSTIEVTYQCLGGEYIADSLAILKKIEEGLVNPRTAVWDTVTNKPSCWPPAPHVEEFNRMYGYKELIDSLNGITDAVMSRINP